MPYLDNTLPLQHSVGWGELGTGGALGYEGKQVTVAGRAFRHALSSHPPARLLYQLGGAATTFSCAVALNDDVAPGCSRADFSVLADGREVAAAADVVAGEAPRELRADVTGAMLLELTVATDTFESCHAVWVDPQIDVLPGNGRRDRLLDCMGHAEIELPSIRPRAERCIATAASPGYGEMLDDMLGSLHANGRCEDALILVFLLGTSPALERVVAKYRAFPVVCRPRRPVDPGSKAPLYSVARVVDARHILCLDADVLVLDDLEPVFAAIEASPDGSVLVCREGNEPGLRDLGHAIETVYFGVPGDLERIVGGLRGEDSYDLVVNDGVFAGSAAALERLDEVLRGLPGAADWLSARPDVWWRNQALFNVALAQLRCGVELNETFNVQLHTSDVQVGRIEGRPSASWRGRAVRVLHFCGPGRSKHLELRGIYASVPDPLVGNGGGDQYPDFLSAVRAWVGRHGISGLTWSFYGKSGGGARVSDPSTLPVLALLHWLVRANGAVRVLETGTAFGVSAACLASAVVSRPGARVVSFDPFVQPEREELWGLLPGPMRACIDARAQDSIEGMRQALLSGERFEAALLDSVHTEEHLWAEWQIARELVCDGGLVLVHDGQWVPGVAQVLERIAAEGTGIVRLFEAKSGASEESGLGLALIENRGAVGALR